MVIYRDSRIGPPQERLGEVCIVVKLSLDLNIGLLGIQSDGCHAFCTVHLINLTDKYGAGAVRILLCGIFHRGVRGGAVVLRPVKFDSP